MYIQLHELQTKGTRAGTKKAQVGPGCALKGEPLTRETASKADENDSLLPHER